MWDSFSGDKVDVRVDAKCGPYIMIAPSEIVRVEELLETHGIHFTLEDDNHPCKGTPEAAVIEFESRADLQHIQQVLDSVR